MDSLDLIYIKKVFSLFIYITPERRYCDVKSEREIFDLRIVVVWPVVEKYTVHYIFYVRWHIACAKNITVRYIFDVRWHIDRRRLETLYWTFALQMAVINQFHRLLSISGWFHKAHMRAFVYSSCILWQNACICALRNPAFIRGCYTPL